MKKRPSIFKKWPREDVHSEPNEDKDRPSYKENVQAAQNVAE